MHRFRMSSRKATRVQRRFNDNGYDGPPLGDWNFEAWSLTVDGARSGGHMLLIYDPGQGFFLEIRSSGSSLWIADTYAYLDGEEKQIQSFQFSRR